MTTYNIPWAIYCRSGDMPNEGREEQHGRQAARNHMGDLSVMTVTLEAA